MHARNPRHPKRFTEPKSILVAVENPSKSISKHTSSTPIRPVAVGNGSRRYNKYFERFDTKSSPIAVARLAPEESTHSEASDVAHLFHQFETRIRDMLVVHKEETVKAVVEAIHHRDCESRSVDPEENIDYIPFFNSAENTTTHNRTTLSRGNYLEFRVDLTAPLLHAEPIIYPFGRETSITHHDHELRMGFESEEGKKGYITGTLTAEKGCHEFISLIRDLQCFLEDETPINFSDIDVPLTVTFCGGLL